jgi:hypothetical protein
MRILLLLAIFVLPAGSCMKLEVKDTGRRYEIDGNRNPAVGWSRAHQCYGKSTGKTTKDWRCY